MTATQPQASGDVARLVRVLRDMNGVLTTSEDWEERVGSVLGELDNLLPMDLAGVLLSASEKRFVAYLDAPLGAGLVDAVRANVVQHYRLLTDLPAKPEEFTTTLLGLRTPAYSRDERANGKGGFRKGSYLSLPLLGVDEIVGVIHIFSLKADAYDENGLALFSLVAAKLGNYLAHVNRHRLMEDYDRERDGFMAEVVHELRGPLTSATGFAQLLMRQITSPDTPNREKEVKLLERVHQQIRRVVLMADSMLDVSRARAGWMSLRRDRVDLTALARRVGEAVQATTDRHQIGVEGAGDCSVLGDELRLEQVLRNLLSNAVKFSPRGGPISVSLERGNDDRTVTVSVRDEGVGISGDQQRHLFERYFRADTATNSRIGGSGLGLYVCSEIIRRHGGEIRVESEVGRGSVFGFTLPAAALSE